MTKKRFIIPLILLVALAIAGYVYWYVNLRGYVSTNDAFIEADLVNVSTTTLERIAHLYAEEGDSVTQGQVLAQFEDSSMIHAPSSGIVARRWVSPSEVVQPGQSILTLYDLSRIWVTANLEETKIARIRVGDPVHLTLDAYKRHNFSGNVARIGAAAASQFSLIPPNNASGNFTKVTQRIPVKIELDSRVRGNDNIYLLPGMSAEVKIKVADH